MSTASTTALTITTICLIIAITCILIVQYQLGVRHESRRSASVLPAMYGIITTIAIIGYLNFSQTSLILIGSQLVVSYWFYFIYESVKSYHKNLKFKSDKKTLAETLNYKEIGSK